MVAKSPTTTSWLRVAPTLTMLWRPTVTFVVSTAAGAR